MLGLTSVPRATSYNLSILERINEVQLNEHKMNQVVEVSKHAIQSQTA